jgi:hypothetical protein
MGSDYSGFIIVSGFALIVVGRLSAGKIILVMPPPLPMDLRLAEVGDKERFSIS